MEIKSSTLINIARYLLISLLAAPFLILALLFDIVKLPLLILFCHPIWLILDIADWLKTGKLEMTILKDVEIWYMGLSLIIEAFYKSHN